MTLAIELAVALRLWLTEVQGITADSVVLAACGAYRDWFVSRSLLAWSAASLVSRACMRSSRVEVLQRVLLLGSNSWIQVARRRAASTFDNCFQLLLKRGCGEKICCFTVDNRVPDALL